MVVLDTLPTKTVVHDEVLARPWRRLASMVRAFRPDVVILVARKMPHLCEHFDLDFGVGCHVFSDLAIPFAAGALSDSRVAIIDDIVNVGSTLDHARVCVTACGAAVVELFSLGRRAGDISSSCSSVRYVFDEPLSEADYEEHVAQVPEMIRISIKPYDLAFPILPCRLNVPYSSSAQITAWLREAFGRAVVHDIGSDQPGVSRYTVDYGTTGNHKVRLYLDLKRRQCNVVPMAIGDRYQTSDTAPNSTLVLCP